MANPVTAVMAALRPKAQFKQPHSIQFGPDGSLYVCDIGNHVIRKIDMKTGLISTFAGIGKPEADPRWITHHWHRTEWPSLTGLRQGRQPLALHPRGESGLQI